MRRHVVLVGLPGSGKSTIGRLVAEQLRAGFTDLDDEIERVSGQTILEIFETRGEIGFRELEREAMRLALSAEPAVLAPGGGWAAQPGAMDQARELAFIIYLAVPAEVAAERCARDGQQSTVDRRPLTVDNPIAVLLNEREPYYCRAEVVVSNAADEPRTVARLVSELARRNAGW